MKNMEVWAMIVDESENEALLKVEYDGLSLIGAEIGQIKESDCLDSLKSVFERATEEKLPSLFADLGLELVLPIVLYRFFIDPLCFEGKIIIGIVVPLLFIRSTTKQTEFQRISLRNLIEGEESKVVDPVPGLTHLLALHATIM